MAYRVTLIPGDGIGPEITAATLQVLDATGVKFEWDQQAAGAEGIERRGHPLPDPAIKSIHATGVALKGPLATPVGEGRGLRTPAWNARARFSESLGEWWRPGSDRRPRRF